jgi:hypothetical protein
LLALAVDAVLEAKALKLLLRNLLSPEPLDEFIKGIDLLLLGKGRTHGQRRSVLEYGQLPLRVVLTLLHFFSSYRSFLVSPFPLTEWHAIARRHASSPRSYTEVICLPSCGLINSSNPFFSNRYRLLVFDLQCSLEKILGDGDGTEKTHHATKKLSQASRRKPV